MTAEKPVRRSDIGFPVAEQTGILSRSIHGMIVWLWYYGAIALLFPEMRKHTQVAIGLGMFLVPLILVCKDKITFRRRRRGVQVKE